MKLNLTYSRDNISPYLGDDFIKKEEAHLQKRGIIKVASGGNIVFTNTHSSLEKLELNQTKLMIHPNSGFDNFTFKWVQKATFPIILGNPIRAYAVANYILGQLFYHFTFPQYEIKWSKQRIWRRKLLSELKILIIGYGHIGKILSKTLLQLGVEIFIQDPAQDKKSLQETDLIKMDIIIPVPSLNQTSYHLINQAFLSQLKSDVVIINASRGPIINQTDLISFLKINLEASAYLDVFEQEPAPLESFKKIPNLYCTSHIAGVYTNIQNKILEFQLEVIHDFFDESNHPQKFRKKYSNLLLNKYPKESFLNS